MGEDKTQFFIFIVHSDTDEVRTIHEFLSDSRFNIANVSDFRTATEFCKKIQPDVILLSTSMIGKGTKTIFSRLRKVAPYCQIVILTSLDRIKETVEFVRKGEAYDYFIVKPIYDIHRLELIVLRALERLELIMSIDRFRMELENYKTFILTTNVAEQGDLLLEDLSARFDKFMESIVQKDYSKIVEVLNQKVFRRDSAEFKSHEITPAVTDHQNRLESTIHDSTENLSKAMGDVLASASSKPVEVPSRVSGGVKRRRPSRKVLVIDNTIAIRKLAVHILRDMDIEPFSAQNGETGLECMSTQQLDLVLLDLHLPKMSGLQVAEWMKNNPKTTDIPIVMMSDDSMMDSVRASFKLKVNDYLVKPFTVERFIDTVQKQLRETKQKSTKQDSGKS